MVDCLSIEELLDLTPYQKPMAAAPDRVLDAIARGVQHGVELPLANAACILAPEGDGQTDGAYRQANGLLVVCCLTELPDNTPEMWDWWFGWHSVSASRYRLWHPQDHVWAGLKEDRRALQDDRARYVGNVSYVDERLNTPKVQQLSISFRAPEELGLNQNEVNAQGTAICARVGFRPARMEMGHLIHLVRRTDKGAQMVSRFWLGDVDFNLPLAGSALSGLVNQPFVRKRAVNDAMGLNLLHHCALEMNHLGTFLPDLYNRFRDVP